MEGPGSLFSSSSVALSLRFSARRGVMQLSSLLVSPPPAPRFAPMLVLDKVLTGDGEESAPRSSLSRRADGAYISDNATHGSNYLPCSRRLAACALALARKPPAVGFLRRESAIPSPCLSPKSSLIIEISRSNTQRR